VASRTKAPLPPETGKKEKFDVIEQKNEIFSLMTVQIFFSLASWREKIFFLAALKK